MSMQSTRLEPADTAGTNAHVPGPDVPEQMDLTRYLQTEGRRIAAERARQQAGNGGDSGNQSPPAPSQHQCAAPPAAHRPPQNLDEALRRMGLM